MLRIVYACLIAAVAGLALAFLSNCAAANGQAAPAAAMLRWAYFVPDDPASLTSLRQRSGDLDFVALHWGTVKADGSVELKARPEVIQLVRSLGARPLLSVALANGAETAHAFLATVDSRAFAVNALSAVLADYDGVSIDFEGLYPEDRDSLTQFMAQLAAQLRPRGKLVTMAVSAKTSDTRTGWAGAHDYAALAPNADLFVIMAYGYRTGMSTVPGSTAPASWVADSLSFAVSQIPPQKILLGIPGYGYDWDTTAGPPARALRYADTQTLVGQLGARVDYDPVQQSAHFSYSKDGHAHEVWFEDRSTAEPKLVLVAKQKLAGVALWRLGHEDPQLWQSINSLSLSSVAQPTPTVQPVPQTAPPAPTQPVPQPVAQVVPQFKLGFKAIADQIPDVVGDPIENEWFDIRNGNSLQRTARMPRAFPTGSPLQGLMVWRKSDNWTAFTDGWTTWVNGPVGLQSRLNSERFSWENDEVRPVSPAPAS